MTNDNPDIHFTLPLAAVNLVLQALAEQAFKVASPVITQIREQAESQLAATAPVAQDEESEGGLPD